MYLVLVQIYDVVVTEIFFPHKTWKLRTGFLKKSFFWSDWLRIPVIEWCILGIGNVKKNGEGGKNKRQRERCN